VRAAVGSWWRGAARHRRGGLARAPDRRAVPVPRLVDRACAGARRAGEPERRGGRRFDGEELRRTCPHCAAIIVPLVDAGQQIGSLILLRMPEQGAFSSEEFERAGTFAHLASLALRKMHLLDDA